MKFSIGYGIVVGALRGFIYLQLYIYNIGLNLDYPLENGTILWHSHVMRAFPWRSYWMIGGFDSSLYALGWFD